jgi:hypothetical protein
VNVRVDVERLADSLSLLQKHLILKRVDDTDAECCVAMPDRLPDTNAVAHGIVGQRDPRPAHATTPTNTLTDTD